MPNLFASSAPSHDTASTCTWTISWYSGGKIGGEISDYKNFGYSEISAGGTGMKPASLSQTLSDIGAGSLADDVEDYPQTDTDYLRTQRDAD